MADEVEVKPKTLTELRKMGVGWTKMTEMCGISSTYLIKIAEYDREKVLGLSLRKYFAIKDKLGIDLLAND